jgi:hypothetical protein
VKDEEWMVSLMADLADVLGEHDASVEEAAAALATLLGDAVSQISDADFRKALTNAVIRSLKATSKIPPSSFVADGTITLQ